MGLSRFQAHLADTDGGYEEAEENADDKEIISREKRVGKANGYQRVQAAGT